MKPIERAARALCDGVGGTWETGPRSAESRLVDLEAMVRGVAFRPNAHWETLVRAVLQAIKYEDGTDESTLLAVSRKYQAEAVSLIEAYDAMIDAALSE